MEEIEKTKEELMKEYYELGEKLNWDRSKILKDKSIVFLKFKSYISEYIKQYNIRPTLEMALFLLNSLIYKKEILKVLIEENRLSSDFEKMHNDYCKFCFILKEQRGKEYCKKKNISWNDVEKQADYYIRHFLKKDDLSKEELMKICYDTCVECNWNGAKVFSRLNLFSKDIKEYVYEYVTEIKKEKMSQESFSFFIDNSTKIIINSYKWIIKLMVEEGIITYEEIQDPIWVEKNIRESISKFCYDLIIKFDGSYDELEKYCDKVGVDYGQVRRLLVKYKRVNVSSKEKAILMDKMQEHINNKRRETLKNSPLRGYALVLNNILKSSNDTEIIDIINNCEQEFSHLKGNLSNYVIVYHNGSKEIREQLEKKLEVYSKYLVEIRAQEKEEQRKEQEAEKREKALRKLAVVQPIINQFLEGKYEKIQDFCDEANIPLDKFNECVDLIKEYDEELYKKYNSYIESKQSKRFIILFTTAKKIIEMIKNGIDNNGKKREFDLVDYYEYTKLSFDELLNILKGKLSQEDYRLLRTFMAKNKSDREMTPIDISNLYKNKIVVGADFDKFGKVIPNTGREITLEEKQNIIRYLKRKNIPVTNKTYNIVYRRWLAGELVIETDDKDKPKKI